MIATVIWFVTPVNVALSVDPEDVEHHRQPAPQTGKQLRGQLAQTDNKPEQQQTWIIAE